MGDEDTRYAACAKVMIRKTLYYIYKVYLIRFHEFEKLLYCLIVTLLIIETEYLRTNDNNKR